MPPAVARWSASRSSCRTAASVCSPPCARSAASTAPNTSTPAPGPGAGHRAMPPAASSPTACLPEQTDHAAHDADQTDVTGDDRLVGRVLGDQLDVAVAALEALHGGVAVDHGHHDRTVRGFLLGAHEDHVAVEDAGVDHAFAAHAEEEEAVLGHFGREEDVLLDVLLGQDGGAGGDVADDRHRDGVAALLVELLVLDQLHGARLAGVAADEASALQLIQVVVHGRARAEAHGLADFTHARRVVPDLGDVADVVEDLCLPVGELIGQFRCHLRSSSCAGEGRWKPSYQR